VKELPKRGKKIRRGQESLRGSKWGSTFTLVAKRERTRGKKNGIQLSKTRTPPADRGALGKKRNARTNLQRVESQSRDGTKEKVATRRKSRKRRHINKRHSGEKPPPPPHKKRSSGETLHGSPQIGWACVTKRKKK